MPKKYFEIAHTQDNTQIPKLWEEQHLWFGPLQADMYRDVPPLSIYYLDSHTHSSPLWTLILTFNSIFPWLLIISVFNSFNASAKHFPDLCSTVHDCVTTCTSVRKRWGSNLLSCPLQLGWAMLSQGMRLQVTNLQLSSLLPWETEHQWLHSGSKGWRAQGCVSRNTVDLFFVSSWHLQNVIRSKWKWMNSKDVIWTCNLASFHGNNIKKERNIFFKV